MEFYDRVEKTMVKKVDEDLKMSDKQKEMYTLEIEMIIKELKAEIEGDSFEDFFGELQDKFKEEVSKVRKAHGQKGGVDNMDEVDDYF